MKFFGSECGCLSWPPDTLFCDYCCLQEGGRDWNSVLIIGQPPAHALNTNLEG